MPNHSWDKQRHHYPNNSMMPIIVFLFGLNHDVIGVKFWDMRLGKRPDPCFRRSPLY